MKHNDAAILLAWTCLFHRCPILVYYGNLQSIVSVSLSLLGNSCTWQRRWWPYSSLRYKHATTCCHFDRCPLRNTVL